ncbi:MAG TPA: hypothetical protein VEX13_18520 [Chloroflexia bacterium]|nr:hypothetical protein [Chloroflexia bacterium]
MSSATLAGPSGQAEWEERRLESEGGGMGAVNTILVLPDASNKSASAKLGTYYYLPHAPLVKRDVAGSPVFSLTLVLSRNPRPDEDTVYPLISQGILNIGLTLDLNIEHQALAGSEGRNTPNAIYKPLFVREAIFALLRKGDGDQPITLSTNETPVSGSDGMLVANLDRSDTLAVLSALDGQATSLTLSATTAYRVAGMEQIVELEGSWAEIHDHLNGVAEEGNLTWTQLRLEFERMLAQDVVVATVITPSGPERAMPAPDIDAVFEMFMDLSSVILNRLTPELSPTDGENRYELEKRPHEMFRLNFQQTLSGSTTHTKRIEGKLADVIGGALRDVERDAFIHLVSHAGVANGSGTPGANGIVPVPRRITVSSNGHSTRKHEDESARPRTQMAYLGGSLKAVSRALLAEDGRAGSTLALLRSDLASSADRLERRMPIEDIFVEDARVEDIKVEDISVEDWEVIRPPHVPPARSLPVVSDPAAPLWVDRLDSAKLWYAPLVTPIQPSPNDDPAASPFLFIFERSGATVSSQPGMDGTARFVLRLSPGSETLAAIEARGRPQALPVPMLNLSIWLQLPFRDESGITRSQTLPATFQQNGDTITATVSLLNEWVRLCYGALAHHNFQREPARLSVAYSYEAYVPIGHDQILLRFGRKSATIPVVYSQLGGVKSIRKAYFDATEVAYRAPGTEIRFRRMAAESDSPDVATRRPPRDSEGGGDFVEVVDVQPSENAVVVQPEVIQPILEPITPPIVPPFLPPQDIPHIVTRPRYATQTLVRHQDHNSLYPCDTFGAFYREKVGASSNSVGCQDAFALGQTRYRQYSEIGELAHPLYRVYRSLQQPGQFLVIPATYRISRYGPSKEGQAYRPTLLVYSTLDQATATNNRVVFAMGLQPDLPPYARRELLHKLSALARSPIIEYPTTIESTIQYAWTIGSEINVEPLVVRVPDGFQVTLSTDLAGALLLRAMLQTQGVLGSVQFKLPDGSSLESRLTLELSNITGPWSSGPVEVSLSQGSAQLVNRIESPVRVSDLVVYGASGGGKRVPVEATLMPGASQTVSLPEPGDEAYLVYSLPPGGGARLEEIRSFIEDIHTNVIFVDTVSHSNHGIERLEVQARVEGLDRTYPVGLAALPDKPPIGEVELTLPLTTYLERRILQFQVTKIFTSGEVAATPWLAWDLRQHGHVISLTWELIQ